MTGDDSYHAACFRCRSCRNRIDELVFAKTSQGFYCMKCHNARVARSREHVAKRQKQQAKKASAGAVEASSLGVGSGAGSSGRKGFGEMNGVRDSSSLLWISSTELQSSDCIAT